ncbi:hypothetical protein ACFWGD_09350 [Corynebacterium sp. NPDC060344]|uniref:hypothetical protein n=1 Tax=Corynebacterium sp. NPDC060344 TaxID=3347101 RepID=UPI00364DAB35
MATWRSDGWMKRGVVMGVLVSASLLAACGGSGSGGGGGGSDVPPENFTLTFQPSESEQVALEGCPDFYVDAVTEQLRYISYNSGGTWQDVEVRADQGDKRVGGTRTCVFTVKNMGIDAPHGALNNLTLTTLGAVGDLAGFDEQALREWEYNRSGSTLDTLDGIKGISAITDDGVKMADQAGLGAVDVQVSSDGVRVRSNSGTSALIAGFERSYTTPFRGGWALVETGDTQNPDYVGDTSASELARVFADAFLVGYTYDKGFWKD